MIDEYEFYHGAFVRAVVVEFGLPIEIAVADESGRVDSFSFNGQVAVHIKHSEKRMSPWQFTFTRDNIEELIKLDSKFASMFICFVCGTDGFVCISPDEFLNVTGPAKSETYWIRVARPRNRMYEVSGNDGTLDFKISRGVGKIVEILKSSSAQKFV